MENLIIQLVVNLTRYIFIDTLHAIPFREGLNTWMENAGAVCPGVLVLTAGLSKPFRRLGKYPAMLQELARHVHEAHPDRGDTHRASVVYKDIAVSYCFSHLYG